MNDSICVRGYMLPCVHNPNIRKMCVCLHINSKENIGKDFSDGFHFSSLRLSKFDVDRKYMA